jgi:imidazolonepropionase
MSLLITNIKELLQIRAENVGYLSGKAMDELPSIRNAYLYIEDDTIVDFGTMDRLKGLTADRTIDAGHKLCYLPGVIAILMLYIQGIESRSL